MYETDCPYCESQIEINYIETDSWNEECSECGENFEIYIEYDPILHSRKYNMQKCIICENKFDKTWSSQQPMPKPYHGKDNICNNCFQKLVIKSLSTES